MKKDKKLIFWELTSLMLTLILGIFWFCDTIFKDYAAQYRLACTNFFVIAVSSLIFSCVMKDRAAKRTAVIKDINVRRDSAA
jgi:hypothetical protein